MIDTNVFVAAAYNPKSASRKILCGVETGEFKLIVSPEIVREYETVLPKAIRSTDAAVRVRLSIQLAAYVAPHEGPSVTVARSDDKFLVAAVAGQAKAVITNDEHLLAVHPYEGIQILQPAVFWDRIQVVRGKKPHCAGRRG